MHVQEINKHDNIKNKNTQITIIKVKFQFSEPGQSSLILSETRKARILPA